MRFVSSAQRMAVMASIRGHKGYRVAKRVVGGTALLGAAAVATAPKEQAGEWRTGARYALGAAALGATSLALKRHAFKSILPAMRKARLSHIRNVRRWDLTVKGGLGIPGGAKLPPLPEDSYLRRFSRDAALGSAKRLEMIKSTASTTLKWKGITALGGGALPIGGAVHLGVRHKAYKKRERDLYARKA